MMGRRLVGVCAGETANGNLLIKVRDGRTLASGRLCGDFKVLCVFSSRC